MNNISINGWGIVIVVILSAIIGAGIMWRIQKPTNAPLMLIDTPPPVQPVFDTLVKTDTITIDRIVSTPTKTETLRVAQEPQVVCPPFMLHLVSSGDAPEGYGLDSVVASYCYPLGDYFFSYWGEHKKDRLNASPYLARTLYYGVSAFYQEYQSKLLLSGYIGLRIKGLEYVGGYWLEGNSHPSWFVGGRKEWRVF